MSPYLCHVGLAKFKWTKRVRGSFSLCEGNPLMCFIYSFISDSYSNAETGSENIKLSLPSFFLSCDEPSWSTHWYLHSRGQRPAKPSKAAACSQRALCPAREGNGQVRGLGDAGRLSAQRLSDKPRPLPSASPAQTLPPHSRPLSLQMTSQPEGVSVAKTRPPKEGHLGKSWFLQPSQGPLSPPQGASPCFHWAPGAGLAAW